MITTRVKLEYLLLRKMTEWLSLNCHHSSSLDVLFVGPSEESSVCCGKERKINLVSMKEKIVKQQNKPCSDHRHLLHLP